MRKKDQGLRDEFIQFVTQRQQEFYRLAFRYTHDQDGAMDVVQEALEKALRALPSLRQPEYMKTWFYRILVNESLTYLRKNKRELLPLQQALEELPALLPPDTAQTMDLHDAIDRLEPQLKTVVMLRFFSDMKFSEIAQVTDTNINTVKSRLKAALGRLRLHLEEESNDTP